MELFDKRFMYLEWDDVLEGKEVFVADCLADLRKRVINNDQSNFERVVDSGVNYPFQTPDGLKFAMAYCDPNYSCKRAYAEGKQIQYRTKDSSDTWKDCEGEPFWGEVCEYREKPEDKHKLVFASNGCLSLDTENVPCILCTGTKEQCLKYATDVMCSRCVNFKTCSPDGNCRGFRKLNPVKKRRWTNRELAQWIMQGNGQVKHCDSDYTLNTYNSYCVSDDDKPCPDYFVVRGWDETEWSEPLIEE